MPPKSEKGIRRPFLVIFSGLPGTGKTTTAKLVAARLRAVYVRVDTIEYALTESGVPKDDLGGKGYVVAYRLATENLSLGLDVVADTVNPWPLTREEWHASALAAGAEYLDVETVCGNLLEHKRRVESRQADIAGFTLPTWQEAIGRDYVPWTEPCLRIDTSLLSPNEAASQIVEALKSNILRVQPGD